MKKSTDALQKELMETISLNQFLTENQDQFASDNISRQLSELCREKKISKSALAKRACLSEVYLHQIISGRRTPSRNRLICLCFGLGASLEETQMLLKLAGYAQLYPRDKRDAVIQHALVHNTTLIELNQRLFTQNMETLF